MSQFTYNGRSDDFWCDNNAHFSNETDGTLWLGGTTSVDDVDVYAYVAFQVNDIPQGARIGKAVIYMTATRTDSTDDVEVMFACQDADSATTPINRGQTIGMTITSATHIYSLESYTINNVYSYDITASVQEVIDRAGWVSGNILGVLIADYNTPGDARRQVAAHEHMTLPQPYLVITTGFVPQIMEVT